MPLIDFKTDLTNLPWGRDRRDGGSSNEPYIKDDIPQGISFDGLPNNSPDFLLRNGLRSIPTAAQDVSRLTQMFFDTKSPKGLQFVAKQNLLSRTSVKTEASKGPAYAGGALNQGAYSPLSTISQAGVNFTGGHLNFLGLGEGFGGSLNKYEDTIKNQPDDLNRLKLLYENVTNNTSKNVDGFILNGGNNILTYSGGPGSELGIGTTNIKFASQRTGDITVKTYKENTKQNFQVFSAKQIENYYGSDDPFVSRGQIKQDFRELLDQPSTFEQTIISLSPKYQNGEGQNVDERTFRGNPGAKNNVLRYDLPADQLTALDKITAAPMYEATYARPDRFALNDLCKFRIAAIDNNRTDGNAVYMHFRAFLDNFDDNYNATWNAVNYVGRGDTLYNYGGFTRTVNLGFTAYAQSKAELIPMYKKLNYLASTLSPDYTQAGFMRGNLLRLTVGGYLYETPGFITSLNYTFPQESTWEIAINTEGGNDSSVKELPHMIRCTMAYTPIHKFLPEKPENSNNPSSSHYISLANGTSEIFNNYRDEYQPYTTLKSVSPVPSTPITPLQSENPILIGQEGFRSSISNINQGF
jgi:hypothetical protein